MNVQKSRKATVALKAPVQAEIDLRNNAKVIDSDVNYSDELAVEDGFDTDCDPYNSTGSHVILQLKEDTNE
jgi:hypothetical protein